MLAWCVTCYRTNRPALPLGTLLVGICKTNNRSANHVTCAHPNQSSGLQKDAKQQRCFASARLPTAAEERMPIHDIFAYFKSPKPVATLLPVPHHRSVKPAHRKSRRSPISLITMTRTFFVGGNWKCNGTLASIKELCSSWKDSTDDGAKYSGQPVEVVIAPPAIYALSTRDQLPSNFQLSLQNCYSATGAYTGEVAADMIADTAIPWVITGHSERRTIFNETDQAVADKTAYAISNGLSVIACIGELLEERDAFKTMEVNERQLSAIAAKVNDWSKVVIAYEPVWAIGTGKVATPDEAQEVHQALRSWLSSNVSPEVAEATRIIYGGSVKPANASDLAAKPDIDGFLVGGASLKPDFVSIIDSYAV